MIAWPLTVGLVVVAVLQLAVQYRLNYWNRDFFNALARHDGDTLWRQVAVFALAIMSVGLSVISVWTRMTTQRKWRQWLRRIIRRLIARTGRVRRLYAVGTVPPSMTYSVPVMEPARGETRKVTRSATSVGLDGRPIGMPPSEAIRPF
jgi:hypothetical protein